jgi:3-dehydroquinate synthase
MPVFCVETASTRSPAIVARGALASVGDHIPPKAGRIFVVTAEDVWALHGAKLLAALRERPHEVLYFPGGEDRKRLAEVEKLAERMVAGGADRTSIVVAFGGGIVGDVAGFLAAVFLRGVPVIQAPTTLLAQVDAAVGGKTGVNLEAGKNLVGAFHQPLAAVIDPEVLATLPEREYRAGLYEIVKCGVIRSTRLFRVMNEQAEAVLRRDPEVLDWIIGESVRIKVEVVSADEREGGLRRILNFGHTFGHALEAETGYVRFLHGEAVAFGMRAATHLAHLVAGLSAEDGADILQAIDNYGPIPPLDGVAPEALLARMAADKKTVHGSVHFVLPERIGETRVVSGVREEAVILAVRSALAGLARA